MWQKRGESGYPAYLPCNLSASPTPAQIALWSHLVPVPLAANNIARAPLKILVCFQKEQSVAAFWLKSFVFTIHNYSTMVSLSSNGNGRCKCPERKHNWYSDQTSTVASKKQLVPTEIREWYPQFFIATSSSLDIRRVSFPFISLWPKAKTLPLSFQHFQMLVSIKLP